MDKYQEAIKLLQSHLNVTNAHIESGRTAPELYHDRDSYLLAIACVRKVSKQQER